MNLLSFVLTGLICGFISLVALHFLKPFTLGFAKATIECWAWNKFIKQNEIRRLGYLCPRKLQKEMFSSTESEKILKRLILGVISKQAL